MKIETIEAHTAAILRSCGFRKRRLTWNKRSNEVIQVFNIQPSRFSDDSSMKFTINLGILSPAVWRICWGKSLPKFVEEDDCAVRTRAPSLLNLTDGGPLDFWWTISASTDIADLTSELGTAIETVFLPFVNQFTDVRDIAAYYLSSNHHLQPIEKMYFAIALFKTGRLKLANDLLEGVSEISADWHKRVQFVRAQLDKS